jgi:predicted amidophosphoribosyltransferase
LSSSFIGHDEYGHPMFETIRTEVGNLLFQLKYRQQIDFLDDLVSVSIDFIRRWQPTVEAIVPVPATRIRKVQPVSELAKRIAKNLALPLCDIVRRGTLPKELKNVFDYHERTELLKDTHRVDTDEVRDKSVLLVDDLFRSGATSSTVAEVLYDKAGVSDVYFFALTRTRSAS